MGLYTKQQTAATEDSYKKRYWSVALWAAAFAAIFLYLLSKGKYHFHYIEQFSMFMFYKPYIAGKLANPGGFAELAMEFVQQFFVLPYCGVAVASAVAVLAGIMTQAITGLIKPRNGYALLWLLPAISLSFVQLDYNYYYSGTLSYLLVLAAIYGYLKMPGGGMAKSACASAMSLALYWLLGAGALLFPLSILVHAMFSGSKQAFAALIPCALAVSLAAYCVLHSYVGEFRFAFLPDGYYNVLMHPEREVYYAWICTPLTIAIAHLLHKKKGSPHVRRIITAPLQIACAFALAFLISRGSLKSYYLPATIKLHELDFYLRTKQWDKIMASCKGELTNFLHIYALNIALGEKGELAEQAFTYRQRGITGMIIKWDRNPLMAAMISDMHYAMGDVALAQQMAFEANESASLNSTNNPRMLKRLVETNLIYGDYAIAEKYINMLERTLFYKNWASMHRRFLNDDGAVENDGRLGYERNNLVDEDFFSGFYSVIYDMDKILEHNPSARRSYEYMLTSVLLRKDLASFIELLDKHGKSGSGALPLSFQEAIAVIGAMKPSLASKYQVSESVKKRFADYQSLLLQSKYKGAQAMDIMRRSFGDTYWYYYMFMR